MKVLVVGYWVWFGISALVLSRRLIVRMTRGSRDARAARDAAAGTSDATLEPAAAGAPLGDLASRVAARLAAQAPDATPPTVAPAPGEVDGAVAVTTDAPCDDLLDDRADEQVDDHIDEQADEPVAPVAPVEAPAVAAAPATLAGTVFAPRPPAPTRSAAAGARTSLAEVLRGMSMPADLAPLVHVSGTDPTRRAVFCTTALPVELVGAEVAEELLRLGFALEPTSATDALARRGDDAVCVRMRAIGPQPPKGPADPQYPTAPAGSVVLDVELA